MILVLLGTQNNSFNRLLEQINKLVEQKIINEEIVVQAGYTKYKSENMKIFDFISKEELEEYQKKADLIITHGGVGSIISAITKDKKVIAIPRLHEYEEHVNNHQKEIVEIFNQKEYIIGINKVEQLKAAIEKIEKFEPKKYISDNSKMIKIVDEFINKTLNKK